MSKRRLALIACSALSIAACRGFVDSVFGTEQPDDAPTDYTLQIVRAEPSTKGIGHYVETGAPADAYLAVRVIGGEVDLIDPALASNKASFCVNVGAGIQQFGMIVRGDGATMIIAALYEPEPGDAVETASPEAATDVDAAAPSCAAVCASGGCDHSCIQALTVGVCPKGKLRISRVHPLLTLDDAAAASEGDASKDAPAESDGKLDAATAEAGDASDAGGE
jgi:hypothetical protein